MFSVKDFLALMRRKNSETESVSACSQSPPAAPQHLSQNPERGRMTSLARVRVGQLSKALDHLNQEESDAAFSYLAAQYKLRNI